jgi:hypothetical protein
VGNIIPFITLASVYEEELPEQRSFIPHDILFPRIDSEILYEFCDRYAGWHFREEGGSVFLDPGFDLAFIVRHFRHDEDQWLFFVRTLKELVDDYMPKNIIGEKFTPSSEAQVRSRIRSKEMSIVSAGGRRFQDELRYRLGVFSILDLTCSVTIT